jgi:hypothetical protein
MLFVPFSHTILAALATRSSRIVPKHSTTRPMPRRQLHINCPKNWEFVPGERSAYRRKGINTGELRISLHPPPPTNNASGPATSQRLQQLLDATGQKLGNQLHASYRICDLGLMATSLWRSPERGLQQYWLIECEISIFASFIMGSLETVQVELAEAQQILNELYFSDPEH